MSDAKSPVPADGTAASASAASIDASFDARARCMCGQVRIGVRFPSRFCAHCHCESCRRAHAAGFVTWVGFKSDQVIVTAGTDDLVSYESSPGTSRTFCRRCGTRMTFSSNKWPGETHVPLACFDTPVDRDPAGHAFVEERAPWIPAPDTAHG